MSHLSYSQVETLLSCGEKYRLTRIVGITEDPAWWFLGGSAVHTATEQYDLGNTEATATELYEAAIAQQIADVDDMTKVRSGGRPSKDWPNGENGDWWAVNGPKFVQSWIDWRGQNPNLHLAEFAGTPAVEVAVGALTDDGVALKGYIDRVFQDAESGDLLIVDLKTGRNAPASSLQMDFYRYALHATLGVDARYGGFWMARTGVISKIHDLWREPAQIADMLAKARVLIDNELFVPHLTMLCNSCGVKQHCTAYTPPSSLLPS